MNQNLYQRCVTNIVAASPGIQPNEAKELLKRLSAIAKVVESGDPQAAFSGRIQDALKDELDKIRLGKLQANVQQQKQKAAYVSKSSTIRPQGTTAKQQLSNFMANLIGSYDKSQKDGGRFSTDIRVESAMNTALTQLDNALTQHGLLEHFTKGIDEDKVVQELNALTVKGGKPGISGSKDAQKVAQIVHNVTAGLIKQSARTGVFIPELQGYTSQQTHDPYLIRREGFDSWFSKIMPRLDKINTFGFLDPKQWEAEMRNKFNNIITGSHLDYDKSPTSAGALNVAYVPKGGNLARQAAAKRTIHFKSPQDAYDYNKEFGLKSFREQIYSSIASISRRTALASEWGVNAESNMLKILNDIHDQAHTESDVDTINQVAKSLGKKSLGGPGLKGALGTPDKAIAEVLGRTRTPAQKDFWHSFMQWAIGARMAGSLGLSTVSAQSDLVNLAGHLATIQGSNAIMPFVRVAMQYYRPLNPGMDTIGKQCSMATQAMKQMLVNGRYGFQDNSGTLQKAMTFYYKWNLLHWHDARIRNITAGLMAQHFGDLAQSDFASLPESEKTWLGRYSISGGDWNSMRSHVQDGYLTPVASDKVTGITEDERDLLRNKFTAMFVDAGDHTVPRAGARERMLLYHGTSANTPLGSLLRVVGLLKTFPVTMVSRVLNRNIYGQSTGKLGTAASVAINLALYALVGYAIYAFKQTVSGKTTSTDVKTALIKGTTQGGGLGYLGDTLLPADDKDGLTSTVIKGAAGPVLGDIGESVDLLNKNIKGEAKSATLEKNAVNLAANYVPFSNHFATKYLFNFYLKYSILNAIDPDYTNRMEKQMQKKDGTKFFIPPAAPAK